MNEGGNTIEYKELVQVEFDPFKEQTITTALCSSDELPGRQGFHFTLKHRRSSQDNFFQVVINTSYARYASYTEDGGVSYENQTVINFSPEAVKKIL